MNTIIYNIFNLPSNHPICLVPQLPLRLLTSSLIICIYMTELSIWVELVKST